MLVAQPNEPRLSCGRLSRTVEFYFPLSAIDGQQRAARGADAPVICKRWLGRSARGARPLPEALVRQQRWQIAAGAGRCNRKEPRRR
jgi:hypothetical protein